MNQQRQQIDQKQSEIMPSNIGNQSCADSVAMNSSVNDMGVYHPHMNNQHGAQVAPSE